MQQIASVLSSREAAQLLGISNTTVSRAIGRGELNASRPREHAPYRIPREELFAWAVSNGYTLDAGDGSRVDPGTGEVLEPEAPAEASAPTPIAAATAARARLAGVPAGQFASADYTREPRFDSARVSESNVATVLLPSADAGLLEAARRLVALPESPELWQALRAVLGVGA